MFKILKRIAAVIGVGLVVVTAIVAFNTIRYVPGEIRPVEQVELDIDVTKASVDLSKAVQFRTVSTETSHPDFERFLAFLQETYPAVHSTMHRILVGGKTPLYKWVVSDV